MAAFKIPEEWQYKQNASIWLITPYGQSCHDITVENITSWINHLTW